MKIILTILFLIVVFVSQVNTITDTDLWGIIKAGEYIVSSVSIPHLDIFSYALGDVSWIDHEWLSQVLYFLIYTVFGLAGLNIFKALIVTACFFILFSSDLFNDKKYTILPLMLGFLSILSFSYRSTLRPEILSYLLLCIYIYTLEKEKRLWILLFLQIAWVNMHGFFILGPLVVLFYCLGSMIRRDNKRAIMLSGLFFLVSILNLLNPYGLKGAVYPLSVARGLFNSQAILFKETSELMMPIEMGFFSFVFFWALVMIVSVTFLLNLKKARIEHALLFLAAFIVSFFSLRGVPVFSLTCMVPALYNTRGSGSNKKLNPKAYYILVLFITASFLYIFLSNGYYKITHQYDFKKTGLAFARHLAPSKACDFLEERNIKGRIFHDPIFGSYIAYRFYPERRMFLDGRTELYGDKMYKMYKDATASIGSLEGLRGKYGFNIVMLSNLFREKNKIAPYLYSSADWKLVYHDGNFYIFLRDIPEYRSNIDRFKIEL
ncbi:MAG: hypothetical protein ABIG92_06050 [Candidatus Omnitrophota bacterium]